MKLFIKYTLIALAGFFILYNSIYFESLEDIKVKAKSETFDPKAYAKDFWEHKLIPNLNTAVELNKLIDLLNTNPVEAFKRYSNALGIGNIRFFLVYGKAQVLEINEDHVVIEIEKNGRCNVATDYIFGNAIRDASGQIDINEFVNTMDFNNVSEEINQIVVNDVLPDFIADVDIGKVIQFHGAIELNQVHLQMSNIEIIPISISTKSIKSRD